MDMAQEYGVVSLPVVIILRDLRVHISGPNSSDIPARIEGMIYQQLCFGSIFRIPNVKPDDSHVRFRRSLNDPRLCCEIHRFK